MLTLTVRSKCEIGPISGFQEDVLEKVKSRFTFENPAYEQAVKHGRWAGNISELLSFCNIEGRALSIPRGATRAVVEILKRHGVPFQIDDQRRELPLVDFSFAGQLRPYQESAVRAMLQREFGVLCAPTGSGKTTMALSIIAERKQPALIIVHTRELAEQWIDRIERFLGIPREEVGMIGGGRRTVGRRISVGMVQSLVKCADLFAPLVGHLVVDECHHSPSRTFTEVVSAFDARYMLGLSATPYRRDGLGRLIWWHLGDNVHEVDQASLFGGGHILKPEVITRGTGYRGGEHDPAEEWSRFVGELPEDNDRNRLICGDIAEEYRAGATCLVLSDGVEHCRRVQRMLACRKIDAVLLNGQLSRKARSEVMKGILEGRERAILATSCW
ncbi:DEAD/DEAH box helicase [Desulforhabdus sp. TSK]|uniref:DEAD/DEAH box helicase n=1 Tax=Desulforhabdus sp. TSK TaxID=2925014 RepID=UPI001FC802CF|nr:DEAD/DEAH box helicase family protein [Desulforhabdus sp. TSK]GKT07780.1 hypothetical protein DSTSK_10850 [Desulforhabdus sp. TSK]